MNLSESVIVLDPGWMYIDLLLRYMRALAAIYIRMTFRAVEVYDILEPLMKDFRKLRYRDMCMLSGPSHKHC